MLQSLWCQCPQPEFADPAAASAVLAPYLPSGGCVAPMRLTNYAVVSQRVVVGLSKPDDT